MNRFNLTFSGEILKGKDPAEVKLAFGKMFAIEDPVRLERFFSGQSIILRRNLERKEAAQYFHELHMLGAVTALVKVTTSDRINAIASEMPEIRSGRTEKSQAALPSSATKVTRRKKVHKPVKGKLTKAPSNSRRNIAAQINTRTKQSLHLVEEKSAREAEESAKKKVAQEKEKLRKAEEAVRRKAEQTARRKAEQEAKQRRKAEEATRRKAKQEEKQRRKAEEAAKRKAEQEEKQRREAEEAARRKAEQEEKQRREAEEAARLKAVQEEEQRRKAEEAAQLKAELDELRRLEAEETARLQAELEEIKHQETAAAAQLQAEIKALEQRAAAEAARIKTESQRKLSEAERNSTERRRASAKQLSAQRSSHSGAKFTITEPPSELEQTEHKSTPLKPLKVSKNRVKTTLEVPQRSTDRANKTGVPARRKRQPGEANLYTVRPFRNSTEVRNRGIVAHQRMRQSYTVAGVALAVFVLAGWFFLRQPPGLITTGADAVAIDPQSGPVLLAGATLLLHDRAGVSDSEVDLGPLGVSAMASPMAFDSNGALLALGTLTAENKVSAEDSDMRLLHCDAKFTTCQYLSPELTDINVSAFVVNPVDGSLLLMDTDNGQLIKTDPDGKLLKRAPLSTSTQPVLRLHAGLLLVNSANGPAISVFRYEDSAFGQQLDEILLLPPAAQTAGQSRVSDFVWSGGAWWVSLQNPETGQVGVYRFDEQWNFLQTVALPGSDPVQLTSWGQKTLINDPASIDIQRFNAQGAIETPFISTQLESLIDKQQRHASFTTMGWRIVLLISALGAIIGLGRGYLQRLRKLVYTPGRERGAEPLDDYIEALHWIEPTPNRHTLLRRRGYSYGLFAIAILLVAVGQSIPAWQLTALLIALSGPAIALVLLGRSPTGHIGIWQDRLLLVDHSGLYHFAGGSSVQYRGPFLLIDDVVVFCGNRLLPAFPTSEVLHWCTALAMSGVKVDRSTLVVKLLQSHHPLAYGALAIALTLVTAALMVCLHGFF